MTETLQEIPLDTIHESPTNTRRSWGDLEGLAESITKVGVLQPVLVRPQNGGHELVFGHRRLRAAKKAGLDAIPAKVRELTDLEVVEAQVIENAARTDLHPIEEAEGYRLLQVHGVHAEEIAAKVGKSRTYVYNRLKLIELAPEARKLFLDEKFSASVAELIARIPDAKLQVQAAKEFADDPRAWPFTTAAARIRDRYMLHLKDAPFDVTDAELLPKAGACSSCPKRTGAQPELFAEVSADFCTDPGCFSDKRDAAWKHKANAARTAGQVVIEGKAAKTVFEQWGGLRHDSGYVDLDQRCYDDPKHRTYRQILKKAKPEVTLARDPKRGKEYELVPKKGLTAALRAAGFKAPERDVPSRSTSSSASPKKAKEEREQKEEVHARAIAEAVALVEKKEQSGAFWTAMAGRLLPQIDTAHEVAERRGAYEGLKDQNGSSNVDAIEKLEKSISSMTMAQIRGLLWELSVPIFCQEPELKRVLSEVGVDLADVAKTVKAERKEAAKASATAPEAKSGSAATKKSAAKKSPARKK
jgi:ParB/RepB/Spo0J family partition protein